MSITVVVGGQFGGEGKGKTVAFLCRNYNIGSVVRCGGPNSGHTINYNGKEAILRQIPAGIVSPHIKLFLAAGCLINLEILFKEIDSFNLNDKRLKIDHNAVIIEKEFEEEEKSRNFNLNIGSTCSGTGIAVSRRAMREGKVRLAKDINVLKPFLTDVSKQIFYSNLNGDEIIIEGTQGFGLSLYHSPYYPYVTSRDTTASGFLSEVGISPLNVKKIIMVIRTFPIRVRGNSGPLPNEIDWNTIKIESGYPYEIKEYTTVTKKIRRVGRFDINILKKAAIINKPTHLTLMGVDYLDFKNKNVKQFKDLTDSTKNFIYTMEKELGINISYIGTGPRDYEIIIKNEMEGKNAKKRTRETVITR